MLVSSSGVFSCNLFVLRNYVIEWVSEYFSRVLLLRLLFIFLVYLSRYVMRNLTWMVV